MELKPLLGFVDPIYVLILFPVNLRLIGDRDSHQSGSWVFRNEIC